MNRLYQIWDNFLRQKRAKRVKGIIKRYNLALVRAMSSRVNHAMTIAIDLMDINIIPDRVYHEFSNTVNNPDPVTDMLFASTMMSRVRRALYDDPGAFPVVMNTFRKHTPLNEVVVLMEKEYYGDTIDINTLNIFWVSFLVGMVIGVLIYLIFWPSSPVVAVHCTEGGSRQLLLKLSSTEETNLTNCLSLHHIEGSTLLDHYYTWCNNLNTTTNVTTHSSDIMVDNNSSTITVPEDGATNSTEFSTYRWCSTVIDLYHKLNLTMVDSTISIMESEGEKINRTSYCSTDLSLLLKCLNIENNYD